MVRFLFTAITLGLALHAGVVLGAEEARPPAEYPAKPIRFIVPYLAGGPQDLLARVMGAKLLEAWGQPVIVDNRTGANGTIACQTTAHSPRDGYTIQIGSVATHAMNPALYKNLPYDPIKDFAPITQVGYTPRIGVAHPSVQAGTVKELIALAKTKRLTYGSPGVGSAAHLAGELFKTMAGVDLVHVPYKGGVAATADLLGGRLALTFGNILNSLPHMNSGKLKAIGITSTKRLSILPDVPAIAETLPGYEVILWWGIFAPAGTPRPIVDKLNREIVKIIGEPELKQRWADEGTVLLGSSPDEFAAFVKAEHQRWAPIVEKSGAREE